MRNLCGVVPFFLGGEIQRKRNTLYDYYRPIELDYTITSRERQRHMKEWAQKSFFILSQEISENNVKEAVRFSKTYLRDGVKIFLEKMNNNNIPVIVMSAGCGNVIKEFFQKEEMLYNNIAIISNFFKFKDNKALINYKQLIYSSNKKYSTIPPKIREIIEHKDKIILFGDTVEDINMVSKELLYKTITIGFLDNNIKENLSKYREHFDIVLTEGENLNTIKKYI